MVIEMDLEALRESGGDVVILDLSTHEAIVRYNESDLSTTHGTVELYSHAYYVSISQSQVLVRADPARADWLERAYASQAVRLDESWLSDRQQRMVVGEKDYVAVVGCWLKRCLSP